MKHQWLCLLCVAMLSTSNAQSDFFSTEVIQDIYIEFDQPKWRYLLDSLRYNGEEVLPATVTINDTAFDSVGVRYRDGRAFTPGGRRNGLFLDLDAFDAGQHFDAITEIDLSSSLRDPTMIREVLGLEIARTYMIAPRANFARVYINEEFYGLFTNQETIGIAFLERHFGDTTGVLYYTDNGFKQLNDSSCLANAYTSLQREPNLECYALNWAQLRGEQSLEPLDELAKRLEAGALIDEVLDVDATLWMLAFDNALVHLNSYIGKYANNYYLYQKPDGRFIPILSNLNLVFGSFKNSGVKASDLSSEELVELDPMLHADNAARPLVKQLLADDRYRRLYLSHYRVILEEYFRGDTLENRVQGLHALIRPEVERDANSYYSIESFDSSLTNTIGKRSRIPGLLRFAERRSDWLKQQSLYTFLPPRISEVEVEERERFASNQLEEFRIRARVEEFPKEVFLYYRWSEAGPFTKVPMLDDGDSYDEAANDNIFGVVVQPDSPDQRTLHYYLEASNARQTGFSPAHYMFDQYQTTLEDIN